MSNHMKAALSLLLALILAAAAPLLAPEAFFVRAAEATAAPSPTAARRMRFSPESSYREAGDYQYQLLEDGTARIIRYRGSASAVTVPDTLDGHAVTVIGQYAFEAHPELTAVTLPHGVTAIGESAFSGLKGLVSITLPDTLTSIGKRAFYQCAGLTGVALPDGLTEIGEYAFGACGALTRIPLPDTLTGIGAFAFSECAVLTDVTLPSGLKTLGAGTFLGCAALREVTVPDGVTALEAGTFYHCTALRSVTLPANLAAIGQQAFTRCESLEEINFPAALASIEEYAFTSCLKLKDVQLPASLTFIGHSAFSNCESLREIVLPASLETVDIGAFMNCAGLTRAVWPESLPTVTNYAFNSCTALNEVILPDTVTAIGEWAFDGCKALKTIVLPSRLTTIGQYAFAYSGLTKVNLPNALTQINEGAFYRCTGLTAMVSRGSYAWEYCEKAHIPYTLAEEAQPTSAPDQTDAAGPAPIRPFLQSGDYYYYLLEDGTASISHYRGTDAAVTVPHTLDGYAVTAVGANAFSSSRSLTAVTLPDGLTGIDDGAFRGCESLISVTLPDTLTRIGAFAFSECAALTDVTLPSGLTGLGAGAFDSCAALREITVPAGVTALEAQLFMECEALRSVTLPDKLTAIGPGAFSGCESLEEIDLPAALNVIGESAFSGCRKLKDVALPAALTKIGIDAFNNCDSLTEIVLPASLTEIGKGVFNNCSGLIRAAWPESISAIPNSAFSGCEALTEVVLPDTVTAIGEWAFLECKALKTIALPGRLTAIGQYAFSYSGLTEITLPDTVTEIGSGAFSDCRELVRASYPRGITSIEYLVFGYELTDLFIPETVTGISEKAFSNRPNLTVTLIRGSYAQEYCEKHQIPYRILDEEPQPTAVPTDAPTAAPTAEPAGADAAAWARTWYLTDDEETQIVITQKSGGLLHAEMFFYRMVGGIEADFRPGGSSADFMDTDGWLGGTLRLDENGFMHLAVSKGSVMDEGPDSVFYDFFVGKEFVFASGSQPTSAPQQPTAAPRDLSAAWAGYWMTADGRSKGELVLTSNGDGTLQMQAFFLRTLDFTARVYPQNEQTASFRAENDAYIGTLTRGSDGTLRLSIQDGQALDPETEYYDFFTANEFVFVPVDYEALWYERPSDSPVEDAEWLGHWAVAGGNYESHLYIAKDASGAWSLRISFDTGHVFAGALEREDEKSMYFYSEAFNAGLTLNRKRRAILLSDIGCTVDGVSDWLDAFGFTVEYDFAGAAASAPAPTPQPASPWTARTAPPASAPEPTVPSYGWAVRTVPPDLAPNPTIPVYDWLRTVVPAPIYARPTEKPEDRSDNGPGSGLLPIAGKPGYRQVPVGWVDATSWIKGNDPAAYAPDRMIDGDETTAYQFSTKKTKPGKAYLYFDFDQPVTLDEMWMKNGFWKITDGKDQYTRNSRVKKMTVDFRYAGSAGYRDGKTVTLKDDKTRADWKMISLGGKTNVTGVRVRIDAIYAGSKYKNDVCISEIMFVRAVGQ